MDNKYIIVNEPPYRLEKRPDSDWWSVKIGLGEPKFLFARLSKSSVNRNRDLIVDIDRIFFNNTDMKFTEDNSIICSDGSTRKEFSIGDASSKFIELFEMNDEEAAIDYFELKRAMTL